MENGLLSGTRALGIPFTEFQVFTPSDLVADQLGAFALGAGGAWMGRYAIGGPFCVFEWEALFGTSPTLGASTLSVRLPVPGIPAPTAELLGGTNSASDILSGSNVCTGNAHLTTFLETKAVECFPAVKQSKNGPHPERQNAIFLPCNKTFSISGAATVASGTKLLTVSHGQANTPSINDIAVTPVGSWQTAGMTQFWVSNVTSTTFDLNATAAAAANLTGNQTFAWQVVNRGAFLSGLFPFDVNASGQFKGSMLYRWR